MKISHTLLRLRARLLREGFVLSAIVLTHEDAEQLRREVAPGSPTFPAFDGIPVVTTSKTVQPSFAVCR